MTSRLPFSLVLLALALLFTSAPVLGQEAMEDESDGPDPASGEMGWTPELAMRYKSVQDVALAPDGDRVAYVVTEALMEGETSEYRNQIHVAATDGSFDRQFTRAETSSYSPAFSPDGSHLAFLSSRGDGPPQVYVLPMTGGEAMQVTDAETGVGSFQFSPDGSAIAYVMTDPKSEAEKQREKEKRDVQIVDEEHRYAHLYTTEVKAHDDTTRQVQRLTGGEFHVRSFDWMPDGSALVFDHQDDPEINTGFLNADISTVPADSGAVTPLVDRPGVDGSPAVSPDGETIAFTSHGGQPEPVGLSDVFLVDADGSNLRKLANTPDRQANIVEWSGDGSAIFVAEAMRTSRHLMRVPANGDPVEQVTTTDGLHGNVSFSADGSQMAFTYENSTTPGDVYLANADASGREQLTAVNEDVPRPEMGRTEVWTWTSNDGTEVEGLVTYPVGYEDGDRVPLAVDVHGGPNGVHVRDFSGDRDIYIAQTFAQHGYAVLRPNPRGSAGYGKAFRYDNVRDWGYGDYEDIMTGVDTAIDRGVAHPDSLVLMGWSYGGYMTSFAVTRTDRFQAASMGAGLPNLISMVNTTDIPDYLVAHMGGEYWEETETYEKHSASYRIENVTTPTQVLHGAQDDRVPTRQGQEFYRALKRRDVATEMVLYPRTPHGPREPKLLMDVTPRIIDWFDEHLGRE